MTTRGRSFLLVSGAAVLVACSSQAADDAQQTDSDLYANPSAGAFWHARTLFYCFEEPKLADMPADVRAQVSSQAALRARWEARVSEFIWAIDATWQAVQVMDFVPRSTCSKGDVRVTYDLVASNADGIGLGRLDTATPSIQINAEYLRSGYQANGHDTYHTHVVAHEMGHVLGFKHEQNRPDSTCTYLPDHNDKGVELTAYDPDSIMNYCDDPSQTKLSPLDIAGFKKAYSFIGTVASTCVDTNIECGVWAANGDCSTNPGMPSGCCASCKSAKPCRDQNDACPVWAASDQCNANPGYMDTFCCGSCFGK